MDLQVFPSDKMPATICEFCKAIMGFCYRFKQMCKEGDALLRIVPNTRIWPEPLDMPQFDQEDPFKLMQKVEGEDQIVEIINDKDLYALGTDPMVVPDDIQILDVVPVVEENIIVENPKVVRAIPAKRTAPLKAKSAAKPKVLNQILVKSPEPEEQPCLKRNKFGNLDIMLAPKPPTVLERDVFPCLSCDRTFPLKQLLEMHEKNHSRDRESACELCPKKFYTKYDLAKVKLPENLIKCSFE